MMAALFTIRRGKLICYCLHARRLDRAVFLLESVQKEAFARELVPLLVLDFSHAKSFAGALEKLHVGSPPLLEAKVNGGRRTQLQKVPKRLQEQRERRLKIHAVCSQDNVGFEGTHLFRQRLAPVIRKGR
jgi:hypothetical protein